MILTEKPVLPTREQLIKQGYPYGKAVDGIPFGDTAVEQFRTQPSVAVFIPREPHECDNEHFLVFQAPKSDDLLALWTQSSCEGFGDNHLMMSRSPDGMDWSEPMFLIGVDRNRQGKQASWGFPITNQQGRIYIFYTREEVPDNDSASSGKMGCIYSDDNGCHWSESQDVPLPRSPFDNPNRAYDKNWIVWQNTIRDQNGLPLAFCTQWSSHTVKPLPSNEWVNQDSRSFLIRFDNLDDNPEPRNVKTTWLPDDENGIAVPHAIYPDISVAQEPSVVLLPDGRLFMVMRTMTGFIHYTVSSDDGHSWLTPKVLFDQAGNPFEHPLSCCPIYRLDNEQYVLLSHNNPGKRLGFNQFKRGWDCNFADYIRNPVYLSIGKFDKDAEQPIRFSKPQKFLDTGDVAIGPKQTAETGTYPSITKQGNKWILWYPDRKYYLLGKYLPDTLLKDNL